MALSVVKRARSWPPPHWAWGALCCVSVSGATWAAGPSAPFKVPTRLSAAPPMAMIDVPLKALDRASADTPSAKPAVLLGVKLGAYSAALIDDNWVKIGQSARGALLTKITPESAHLRHPDGRREILALSPDAQWKLHTPPVKAP